MFKSLTYLQYLRYGVIILCLFLAAACLVESITVILQTITEFGLAEANRVSELETKRLFILYLYEKKVEILRIKSSLELVRKLADGKLLHIDAHVYTLGFFCGLFGGGVLIKPYIGFLYLY
uniref:Orf120 n=1 Tax=Protohalopteris sp. TaxID=2843287 RepID=A0A8F0FCZ0_9PHAE|nr:orf120 [Protohalopteris sp.]